MFGYIEKRFEVSWYGVLEYVVISVVYFCDRFVRCILGWIVWLFAQKAVSLDCIDVATKVTMVSIVWNDF